MKGARNGADHVKGARNGADHIMGARNGADHVKGARNGADHVKGVRNRADHMKEARSRAVIWIALSFKRYITKAGFLVSLLLLPVLCGGLRLALGGSTQEDNVVVLWIDEDGDAKLENELVRMLEENVELFSFRQCSSREELEQMVSSLKAECGVIIHGNLAEKVRSGDTAGVFEMVSSPSSTMVNLCIEYVYSQYACLNGSAIIEEAYAQELALSGEGYEQMKQEVEEIYHGMLEESDYKMFTYVNISGREAEKAEEESTTFPVRGFAAIYLLFMGLFCCSEMKKDERMGVYHCFAGAGSLGARCVSIMAPLLLVGISALLGLYISGDLTALPGEILALTAYIAVISFLCVILGRLIRNEKIIMGMIPAVILACLIFCPVFFDISAMIPLLRILEKFLLPTYYIRCFG